MNHRIKIWVAFFFVVLTLMNTFGFPLNHTSSKAYGGSSTTGTNQATETFSVDRTNKSQSPDTDSSKTEAKPLLDAVRYLLRDDVTPVGANKIDAVNNFST